MVSVNRFDLDEYRRIFDTMMEIIKGALMQDEDFKKYVLSDGCYCHDEYGDGYKKAVKCDRCKMIEKYGWEEED